MLWSRIKASSAGSGHSRGWFLTFPPPLCSSEVLLIFLFFFPLTAHLSETEQGKEKGILGPLWQWDKLRGKVQDRAEH